MGLPPAKAGNLEGAADTFDHNNVELFAQP